MLVSPVVLLHAASVLLSWHERSMRSFASNTLAASGHTLHYYELSPPEPEWRIVFIHGTPGSGAVFSEQFEHPFPRADLISVDRPGFGASRPARRKPSLDDQANAIGALLTQLAPHRTLLVGHSYGAPVALLAALKFTNQVSGLLLIGGSVDPSQEKTYLIQRIGDWPLFSWLLPRPLRQCNRELLTLGHDLQALQPRLRSLAVPVLMLHGGSDPQVPVANVDYLRHQLELAGKTNLFSRIVLPHYNHFIPWQHPEAVQAALMTLTHQLSRTPHDP